MRQKIYGNFRRTLRKLFRFGNLPAVVALVVSGIAIGYAEYQNREIFIQSQRTMVVDKIGLVRARIEGTINSNVQLVHGMASVIASEPYMTQERFSELASYLFTQPNQLLNIAAAPNLVVHLVYPYESNNTVIGLDYTKSADQRDAALRARDTGEIVLAGPVHLVQGGRGFIGRLPIFISDYKDEDYFWGILSAVIDAEELYADAGIFDLESELDIAISGRDGQDDESSVFFGDSTILSQSPVQARVSLPTGSWLVSAIPAGGWKTTPPNAFFMRVGMVILAGLVLIPIFLLGRLSDERRRRMLEQRRRETELARLSRRLELALATSRVGVWEMNITSGQLSWDERMMEIFGLDGAEAVIDYPEWTARVHPDDFARAEREFNASIRSGERYISNYRIITPNGDIRHVRAIGAIYQEHGASPRMVGVTWDVTPDVRLSQDLMRAKTQAEAKNLELETTKARIEHNALHDPLTGLPNRRYLDDMLVAQCGDRNGLGQAAAILHVDLDRFKQINDTLGHAAGDAMLVHASKVLLSSVRGSDFVARIGGDEFVIVCMGEKSDDELRGMAERIINEMRKPVVYEGQECRFGVSIGIASGSLDSENPKELLINADIALYRAKGMGRSRAEFFSRELQAEIVSTKRTADDILSGLDDHQFLPFYQPQVDPETLEVIGMEALARWAHPKRGILAPDSFMSIAEDLNVVATIDQVILEQALVQRAKWMAKGVSVPRISVNVSARRLADENLIATLKALKIEPGTVSFELIESIYLDESDATMAWNIDQIKDMGIDIEIDDFGTGYASIVSLLSLRPTRLKIDRQLIAPIVQSQAQRALVASIIDIGSSLGIEVIAEGVETMEHAEMLALMGCAGLQGYAFAKPMAADDLTAFLKKGRTRKVS